MNASSAYTLVLLWCALHFILFIPLRSRLRLEKRIFAYHLASFLFLVVVASICLINDCLPFVTLLGLLSLHGLYSLCFLWLWSATQGSYSLAILREVERCHGSRQTVVEALAQLGADKRKTRILSLQRLKLIRSSGDVYALTGTGQLAATTIRILRWVANYKVTG
jgi:hypothetical protein